MFFKKLLALIREGYSKFSADTRFRNCQVEDKKTKIYSDGSYEIVIEGNSFHVYDLRPALEKIWKLRDKERRLACQ